MDNESPINKRLFSSPTTVNLELTELCNVKCTHCYNPWRDESMGNFSIDENKLNLVIDQIIEAKVFHVVLTGGEPMSNFEILVKAIKKLSNNNISVSCNSNLILATNEKAQILSEAGLDHILTSIPSTDPIVNDLIMQSKNSLQKICDGITACIKNGIRISANMVVLRTNMNKIYETGKMAATLGCDKFFITRAVPPTYSNTSTTDNSKENEYNLSHEETKKCLDEVLRVKDDFQIRVGSLVSYPLCFLEDLEKYKDFVGRGCPSQSGHRMNINANGNLHVCVHEEESYGNIFDISIEEAYQNKMRKWHTKMTYKGCEGCEYLHMCSSGCQMIASAVNGKTASRDPLYVGPNKVKKHYNLNSDLKEINKAIDNNAKFSVPKRIRFREEKDFFLVNIRWGNTISVSKEIGEFLFNFHQSGKLFTLKDFGENKYKRNWLINLYFKDVIETPDFSASIDLEKKFAGVSANIENIPSVSNSI